MLFSLFNAKKIVIKLQKTKRAKGMDRGVRKEKPLFLRKNKVNKITTDP
jgi:acyl CoA:acetate/3-ketoacid CoA transferase beta subunit